MPKTKAQQAFEQQTRDAMAGHDWPALELAYSRYGSYLELVGEHGPVGEERSFSLSHRKLGPEEPAAG